MSASRTIVIAGAGIGGLTLALHVAKLGFRAVVLERAEELTEVGAGIQLSPNAMRVLVRLGLGDALAAVAKKPAFIEIHNGRSGSKLTTIPLGEQVEKTFGAPYFVIHRADLQQVLYDAAKREPDISIELGLSFVDAAGHANGITVSCDRTFEPEEIRGVGLIGADGVWSRVRRRVIGGPEPVYTNRTAWRATIPVLSAPPAINPHATGLWLGRDAHLVHYPISAGRKVNIVAVVQDDWKEEDWSAEGEPAWLLERFATWAPAVRDLLRTPDRWLKWALCGVDPAFTWSDGPVTLLGDAAHAMLPFLAQGGAMAIEDAAVLASCLAAKSNDIPAAFRDYEAARKGRVTRVVREAAENGRIYHWSGPAAVARDLMLRSASPLKLLSRYDWLYSWQPPALPELDG